MNAENLRYYFQRVLSYNLSVVLSSFLREKILDYFKVKSEILRLAALAQEDKGWECGVTRGGRGHMQDVRQFAALCSARIMASAKRAKPRRMPYILHD